MTRLRIASLIILFTLLMAIAAPVQAQLGETDVKSIFCRSKKKRGIFTGG